MCLQYESTIDDVIDISSAGENRENGEPEVPNQLCTDYLQWHSVKKKGKSSMNRKCSNNDVEHDNILSLNKYRSLVIDDMSDFDNEFEKKVKISVYDSVHNVTQREVQKKKRPQMVTNKYPKEILLGAIPEKPCLLILKLQEMGKRC